MGHVTEAAWGNGSAWSADRILALADDADRGAFLEVDLQYPVELHDSHNDFPMSPYAEALVGKAWMKPYIDFNTAMRTAAKNDFEKDLYKLMNNACFGKTTECSGSTRGAEQSGSPRRVIVVARTSLMVSLSQ